MSVVPNYAESADALNRTIHEIKSRHEELNSRGDEWTETQRAVSELKEKARTLELAQREMQRPGDSFGPESELRKYVETDARRVKGAGGAVDATKGYDRHHMTPKALVHGGGTDNGVLRLSYTEQPDGTWDYGLLDDPAPVCEWQKRLQVLVDQRSAVRAYQKHPHTPQLDHMVEQHMRAAPVEIKRIFADSSTIGAEWIPDMTLPMLEMELRAARRLEALFGVVQAPNSGTITIPFLSTGLRPYLAGAAAVDDPAQYTSSSVATAGRTFTVGKLAVRAQIDEDAVEDAIIMALPIMRQEIVDAITDGFEDVMVNGDATATHQDAIASWDPRSRWGSAGLGGSGDHRRLATGLRARAFDVSNTNDGSSAKTAAGALAARASLDSPHQYGSVAYAMSPEYLVESALAFDEVETVDKLGPAATIRTGQLASLYGAPVYMTEFLTNDLHTTGLYTGASATTGYLVVNTDRFKVGVRRAARIEMDKDLSRGIFNLVTTARKTFFTFDSATKKNVRFEFNL